MEFSVWGNALCKQRQAFAVGTTAPARGAGIDAASVARSEGESP
jgi:hypothetical protein